MALPTSGGGRQIGDGNRSEVQLGFMAAPSTATATASLTNAQLFSGIILGSPGSSAAAYTTPTATAIDTALVNAKIGATFDLTVVNVDGSSSGVITLTGGTGVTAVGLATVVATAGTAETWRFRKTASAAWSFYRT
tara:strand:+ start:4950 stop:5357 length:408 start_codon:yes stop_codon:yes gene_type:complete